MSSGSGRGAGYLSSLGGLRVRAARVPEPGREAEITPAPGKCGADVIVDAPAITWLVKVSAMGPVMEWSGNFACSTPGWSAPAMRWTGARR